MKKKNAIMLVTVFLEEVVTVMTYERSQKYALLLEKTALQPFATCESRNSCFIHTELYISMNGFTRKRGSTTPVLTRKNSILSQPVYSFFLYVTAKQKYSIKF